MAASTFAALLLAHVIADYLVQTRWLVDNKHRPLAIGLHVAAVLAALPLVTLTFSVWFAVLAALHLAIDLTKTHLLRGGLPAYVADQVLHLVSLVVVAGLAPGLWGQSPLAAQDWLPPAYLITAALIFAVRGGQYAVTILPGPDCGQGTDPEIEPDHVYTQGGLRLGWVERGALLAVVAMGAPLAMLGVLTAKGVHVACALRTRDTPGRRRMVRGSAVSMGWGLASAIALWAVLPTMG